MYGIFRGMHGFPREEKAENSAFPFPCVKIWIQPNILLGTDILGNSDVPDPFHYLLQALEWSVLLLPLLRLQG